MKIYLVGGAVRDRLLGIVPKDLDYVMVLDNVKGLSSEQGFEYMKRYMENEGYKIFVTSPENFTIRAKFPKGHKNSGQDADFVLARKEVGYVQGTRQPILELGTLHDDLKRRDFTINAMAEDEDGSIIDIFNGRSDLENGVLRTPLDPMATFSDDPLRMLRALRFSLTKGMEMVPEMKKAMGNPNTLKKMELVVSQERIREELLKMFRFDTAETIKILEDADSHYFFGLLKVCFGRGMWLEPTMKAK